MWKSCSRCRWAECCSRRWISSRASVAMDSLMPCRNPSSEAANMAPRSGDAAGGLKSARWSGDERGRREQVSERTGVGGFFATGCFTADLLSTGFFLAVMFGSPSHQINGADQVGNVRHREYG